MHRLFVALRPPEAIRDPLIDTMEGLDGARWQSDEQLHLTLRFVGEVDRAQANDLVSALQAVRAPGFPLQLRGVGTFARKGRPSALWAGVERSEPLAILHRRVERACRAAGLAPETRRFVPHVTIARLNASTAPVGGWLATHGRLALPVWQVDNFQLFESRLERGGSVYEPVVEFPLAPAD
ncbi:RNA 2',3'-cyclic phosphodiesterase [Alteriqipengyuania lutimaris]|uniref:RNA 2',3'-cyclic phosphodiesterase n=1 Tax=Alteriqipengyuania lutimaris TaxID=1538146 RepID=A0A395LGF1_9SPHN|nr:RNA 2',3'-cyclic phosphodiesterase [Alteriqipengyuania lutimaris]MBB3035268.1 2'-5' RNA ligase [Alteriqipengyuania lutimaris]RDS75862.1 RNA 2',3'-cyclic phosphodiesterase [Alteriqipengyuania lutimaris]